MNDKVSTSARFAFLAVALFWITTVGAEGGNTGNAIHIPLDALLHWSHSVVGAGAAIAGVLAHRAWSRRRWHRAPAGVVIECVLAVDIVNSTWLATHHGEDIAMRARNVLKRRALEAANLNRVIFVESTGDGFMMTFASVHDAATAATALIQGLHDRAPDMAPAPKLEVRAAISYGQLLMDAKGARHGTTINKAFRLMAVPASDFVNVEGEERMTQIPDGNRLFLDEDAVNELDMPDKTLGTVGICRLKGFSGFHRVYLLDVSREK